MKKLNAGSLQLVTFIIVVIALLLASFILLVHIHKKFRIKTNHIIETVGLVDKGINHILKEGSALNDTITINLDDGDYKSVRVHSSFWGAYEKIHSHASIKNHTLKKMALVGSKRKKTKKSALYLKDNNKPLVVVGNTKIKGKAHLPKRGVKSGNISGTSYYGEEYIYGAIATCKNLPRIDSELLNHLKTISKAIGYSPNEIRHIDLKSSKSHINSFESPLQLAYSDSELFLSDISIFGHIVIQSRTKIIVDSSANLSDVILISPIIEIRAKVKGVFQGFATEHISISEHVTLDYPSALVLNRDYAKAELSSENMISIADHSTIKGNVIALGLSPPGNYEAQIKISANAIVKGIVYCEQNLELRGTVYGTVYTNNFIIKEAGSIYQNHLYNAMISPNELKAEFISSSIENTKKGIAKWLY